MSLSYPSVLYPSWFEEIKSLIGCFSRDEVLITRLYQDIHGFHEDIQCLFCREGSMPIILSDLTEGRIGSISIQNFIQSEFH